MRPGFKNKLSNNLKKKKADHAMEEETTQTANKVYTFSFGFTLKKQNIKE